MPLVQHQRVGLSTELWSEAYPKLISIICGSLKSYWNLDLDIVMYDCNQLFQYLGATQEVSGRTILEEGETVEIPILYRTSSILMPGQTIPLILFEDNYVSLMKKLIKTTKTFGLVNRR